MFNIHVINFMIYEIDKMKQHLICYFLLYGPILSLKIYTCSLCVERIKNASLFKILSIHGHYQVFFYTSYLERIRTMFAYYV